jgi:tryptophanyl-tRNA synthetase
MKKVVLTGDRPTGALHLGHYVGSLAKRVELQETCETYIMIADAQALTDNYDDVTKVRVNIHEVVCDYLAVGIDPLKSSIFIQSCIPELPELAMYYMNLVSIQHLGHNPTVKAECRQKGYNESVPAGFYMYPIFQVADITAFKADLVPVGLDQAPMLELTREIVGKFNRLYKKDVLTLPEPLYPSLKGALPGIDGAKMSKSLGNAILLSDELDSIVSKVKKVKSDPGRKSATDPGNPEEALAFAYLEIFDPEVSFVEELKERYRRGSVSDKEVKDRLIEVLDTFIKPIRERRKIYHSDKEAVWKILKEGTDRAKEKAAGTLSEVRLAMGIQYNSEFIKIST